MKAKILCFSDRMAHRGRHLEATRYDRAVCPPATMPVSTSTAPRRSLRALWQPSPVTGRPEMRWQAVEAGAGAEAVQEECPYCSTSHPQAA